MCPAGGKRASVFISRGATQILLHVLVCESKDDECLSELLVAVHQLLAKLGPRGNDWPGQCRCSADVVMTGLVSVDVPLTW